MKKITEARRRLDVNGYGRTGWLKSQYIPSACVESAPLDVKLYQPRCSHMGHTLIEHLLLAYNLPQCKSHVESSGMIYISKDLQFDVCFPDRKSGICLIKGAIS